MSNIAIGIDFGTTNSLIAAKIDSDVFVIPHFERSKDANHLLKSVVLCSKNNISTDGEQRWILESNKKQDANAKVSAKDTSTNPTCIALDKITISSVKRLLSDMENKKVNRNMLMHMFGGLDLGLESSQHFSNKKIEEELKKIGISVGSVVEQILFTLKQNAENYLNNVFLKTKEKEVVVSDVVITVPAHFDENARQKIKQAAKNVGLNVLRLLNEPTAAAIGYGMDTISSGVEKYFAVYDMGGGTFDVSIMRVFGGVLQVVATGGDEFLGGDDFDLAIAEYLFLNKDFLTFQDALIAAKRTKESLEDDTSLDFLFKPLIERSIAILHKVCADVHISVNELTNIILVGGGTKLKAVQNAIQKLKSDNNVLIASDPESIVAIGAAMHAYNISYPNSDNIVLLDVVPMTLGMETVGGIVEPIIFRNTNTPCETTRYFTTYADNQIAFLIKIYQGESLYTNECRLIGDFEIGDLPLLKAGEPRLAVTFKVDVNGLLSVEAKEEVSGLIAQIKINISEPRKILN